MPVPRNAVWELDLREKAGHIKCLEKSVGVDADLEVELGVVHVKVVIVSVFLHELCLHEVL